jgi:hypothetical protein
MRRFSQVLPSAGRERVDLSAASGRCQFVGAVLVMRRFLQSGHSLITVQYVTTEPWSRAELLHGLRGLADLLPLVGHFCFNGREQLSAALEQLRLKDAEQSSLLRSILENASGGRKHSSSRRAPRVKASLTE